MDLMTRPAVYTDPGARSTGEIDLAAPRFDWREMEASEHFVQFYESDDSLIRSVSDFMGSGLSAGEHCIVIATPCHRENLTRDLTALGHDVDAAIAGGQFVLLDAQEMLQQFMIEGAPQPMRFVDTVGRIVARGAEQGRRIRAFGEMVALLWSEGNHTAAIDLEQLWNELAKSYAFCLFCAYAMDGFDCPAHAIPFEQICVHHTHVIPAESYARLDTADARLREITLLQQKAKSLEAEIAHRKEVEAVLARRERELSDFVENSLEGLHRVGPDGRILWANRAEMNLLGYAPDEYIGHHIAEFHVDAEVIADMLGRLLGGESLYDYPAKVRCKDGSIKHLLVHSNACFEDGKFVYTRCFSRDVTERQAMEQRLHRHVAEIEALNARLKRSVTETHHRVKNNLQLMAALIEMQRQTERDTIPVTELVRLGQNIKALGVIHDILTLQSKEDGNQDSISATKVLERLLPMLQGTLTGRRLEITLDEVWLPGKHTTSLALIANELVSNAVKHGQGNIQITLRNSDGIINLEVCDDGPGFPQGFDADTAAHTGLDLIENIARFDLSAVVNYETREEGGARVSVRFVVPTVHG
jgi:PAS domain S-box-containing protein